jgi:hypothetical protein
MLSSGAVSLMDLSLAAASQALGAVAVPLAGKKAPISKFWK